MDGDQLSLQVSRDFGQCQAVVLKLAEQFVTIALALRRGFEIEKAWVVRGKLQPFEAEAGCPCCDAFECIARGLIADKLGDKQGRPLNGFHREPRFEL